MTFEKGFSIKTQKVIGLTNITAEISEIVKESGLKEGLLLVHTPHTTAALLVNEDEPRLRRDFEKTVKEIIPWKKSFEHNQIDNNAPSHLVSSIIGQSLTLMVSRGEVSLGTWQSIFLVELDGPRSRQVKVKIIGE